MMSFRAMIRRSHTTALTYIAVANVLDIATTLLALRYGAIEANPISAFLMEYHLLWPLKVGLPAFALLTHLFEDRLPKWRFGPEFSPLTLNNVAWMVAGVYSLVVVLNTCTLLGKVT